MIRVEFRRINLLRSSLMKRIEFLAVLVALTLLSLHMNGMKPVATTPSTVGDDWYSYAINHGLANPVKVVIENRLSQPLQIIYKKLHDYAWDAFPKTLTAINDVTSKTAPLPAYTIRTTDSKVYILDFEPFTASTFMVTLSRSQVEPQTINQLPIVNQLALSRDPGALAQMVKNNPKSIIDTREFTKGATITVNIEEDGAYLTNK
jgi:hypothetical protein